MVNFKSIFSKFGKTFFLLVLFFTVFNSSNAHAICAYTPGSVATGGVCAPYQHPVVTSSMTSYPAPVFVPGESVPEGDCACTTGNFCARDSIGMWGVCTATSAPSCASQGAMDAATTQCPSGGTSCTGKMSGAFTTPVSVSGKNLRARACACPTGQAWNGTSCISTPACDWNTSHPTPLFAVFCKHVGSCGISALNTGASCIIPDLITYPGNESATCLNSGIQMGYTNHWCEYYPMSSSTPAKSCHEQSYCTTTSSADYTNIFAPTVTTFGICSGTKAMADDVFQTLCPGPQCLNTYQGLTIPNSGGQKVGCATDTTGMTGCCTFGPGTPTCTGAFGTFTGFPGPNEFSDPTKCTPGFTGCCATGPGTPTCTGVGGLPTSTEYSNPWKCTFKTPCCATGAGTPTCTGVGGIASSTEVADWMKCNVQPTCPPTGPPLNLLGTCACMTGAVWNTTTLACECPANGPPMDIAGGCSCFMGAWDGTSCKTPCCSTGPGTPTCTGTGGIANPLTEVSTPSKCTSTSLTQCCATGPGTPACTGTGGIANPLTEISTPSKCTLTQCCATGPGAPACTGTSGAANPITEVSTPSKCSSIISGSTVLEASNGASCGTKRIVVNADNTVYTNKNGTKTSYFQTVTGSSHCACSYLDYAAPSPASINNNGTSIPQTLPPDTYKKISSQNNSGTLIDYSPVAIARDSKEGTRDGRVGSLFSTGASQCGCPNLNEVYAPLIPGDPNKPQGAYCRSALTGAHQVLMTFNPDIHDATPATTQVIDRTNAITDTVNDEVVTKIALPITTGGAKTQAYTRRIWACSTGFVVDVTNKKCIFKPLEHQCSGSVTNGALASAVSSGVSGNDLDEKFTHTINKKLSCCLNAYTKGFSNLKFDCIDNSSTADTSFDALWASSDLAADGGQLNAVVLSDSKGKPVSGFYTLDGSRCSGYSEFGGILQPRTVNPVRSVTGQIESVVSSTSGSGFQNIGSPLPTPSGAGYTIFSTKTGFNHVPTTQAELARCPILVRAAMKAECGTNEAIPAVQTTIDENSALGLPGSKKRCTNASKISIHVQVMQLTKIAGMAPMKTFDTVADPKNSASINIGKIVGSKNSGECADGAKRVGSQCVYQ